MCLFKIAELCPEMTDQEMNQIQNSFGKTFLSYSQCLLNICYEAEQGQVLESKIDIMGSSGFGKACMQLSVSLSLIMLPDSLQNLI